MKKFILVLGVLVFFCLSQGLSENITLTTYYPAPIGTFQELRAERAAIGPNFSDPEQYCWPPDSCTNEISLDTSLIVEGNIGIGTHSPDARLHVDNQGANTSTVALFDDSTPAVDPWELNIALGKQGQELVTLGIAGGIDSGNPSLDNFNIDLSTTANDNDLVISSDGNLGIGADPTSLVAPNGVSQGNLEADDLYLGILGDWVSNLVASGTGSSGGVFTLDSSGSAVAATNASFLVGATTVSAADSGTTITWANNSFSQIAAVFFHNVNYNQDDCWDTSLGFPVRRDDWVTCWNAIFHQESPDQIWAKSYGPYPCPAGRTGLDECTLQPANHQPATFFAIGTR